MESDFIISSNIRECDYGSDEWKSKNTYISKSGLVKIKESPAHFKEREPFIETPEIIFGKMYHCFVLQPEKFKNDYYVFDDSVVCGALVAKGAKSPRSTNDYKEWYKGEMSFADGKILIEKTDFDRMTGMKDRLMQHPYAKMLLNNLIAEKGMIGELETKAGLVGIKFIPDGRNDNKHLCIELKTTVRASKLDFPKEAANYDYHIQAAFYADLLELYYNDKRPVRFVFIAQEKRRPYAFNIFEAGAKFIAQGRYEYEMLLQLYRWCLENNKWPGYQVFCPNKYGILELNLPGWAIQSLDYFIY